MRHILYHLRNPHIRRYEIKNVKRIKYFAFTRIDDFFSFVLLKIECLMTYLMQFLEMIKIKLELREKRNIRMIG